jgi:hypothetical protein
MRSSAEVSTVKAALERLQSEMRAFKGWSEPRLNSVTFGQSRFAEVDLQGTV